MIFAQALKHLFQNPNKFIHKTAAGRMVRRHGQSLDVEKPGHYCQTIWYEIHTHTAQHFFWDAYPTKFTGASATALVLMDFNGTASEYHVV